MYIAIDPLNPGQIIEDDSMDALLDKCNPESVYGVSINNGAGYGIIFKGRFHRGRSINSAILKKDIPFVKNGMQAIVLALGFFENFNKIIDELLEVFHQTQNQAEFVCKAMPIMHRTGYISCHGMVDCLYALSEFMQRIRSLGYDFYMEVM